MTFRMDCGGGRRLEQKLIIDADPGIGDALVIALALLNPEIDLIGITPTAGCTSGENASRNVHAIVGLLDPLKWPRVGWAEGPVSLADQCGGPNPKILNGPTGLGELKVPVAAPHQKHDSPKLLVDLVRTHPNEVTLLTLGPLTNLELAQERCPEFLSLLKGVVILGGSVAHGGDATASAEFNMFADPEAARSVLSSPATKTLVPLDATRRVMLTFSQYDRLAIDKHTRFGRLLDQTLPFAFRAQHEHLGVEGFPLAEVVALAAVLRPDLFQRKSMSVDVETQGELTRGMTVFDNRRVSPTQHNIDVLMHVDSQSILDLFTLMIRNSPTEA
ncbi:MAG: nucleoside hydrolase [Planctomycetaceae bacterium]|nr:nucleoside hydrolase [Planctomycetaceae bacterium]